MQGVIIEIGSNLYKAINKEDGKISLTAKDLMKV